MRRIFVAVLGGLFILVGSEYSAQVPQVRAKFLRHAGQRVPGQYIVVLRPNVASQVDLPQFADQLSRAHGGARRHVYTHALEGFAVRLPEAQARRLSEDPRVAYVEEDGMTYLAATQTPPPSWGLDRIDQRSQTLDSAYKYFADGTGVNVYVVDTGIRTTHTAFEGRAFGAYSTIEDGLPLTQDCHGHGTHVAGTVGSNAWGVAKKTKLHSVKTLACNGTGSWSDYVEGLDWIVANHVKPAVVNASIAGGVDYAAVDAIERLVAAGITFVGAAGNSGADACQSMPGAAHAFALIVGNSTPSDERAGDSNWGACVDLYAPGSAIGSASNATDAGSELKWGTSMAAPHVAGAAALYLQRFPTAAPATVTSAVLRGASAAVSGDPSTNLLLFSPYLGDTVPPTVTMTSPASGTTLSGNVALAAGTAGDNVELAGVRFFVGSTQIGYDTESPYAVSWNTTAFADATYTLRARAVDLTGNTADSTVSVRTQNGTDTTPPSVSLTSPSPGATLKGIVTPQANASDDVAVGRVEFLVNSTRIGSDSSAPYTVNWNTTAVPDGAYTLVARAFDIAGNTKVSSSVAVEVDNLANTLPAGWTNGDVGAVGVSGSAAYATGTFRLQGGGVDVWSTTDAFHYAYRSWTGDGEIVARVAGLTKPSGAAFAMAGVMFRESLAANARHAAVLVSTEGKLKFRRRATVGGATLSDGPSAGSVLVPHWVKVTRRGNVFTAYRSADGTTWTQVGPPAIITLPTTLHVGVWALRNGGTTAAPATFTNVAVKTPGALLVN